MAGYVWLLRYRVGDHNCVLIQKVSFLLTHILTINTYGPAHCGHCSGGPLRPIYYAHGPRVRHRQLILVPTFSDL